MKNTRITIKRTLSAVLAAMMLTAAPIAHAASALTRIGAESRTVLTGEEIELKVKRPSGVRENDLKWTIKDTAVLSYADDDRYDDEMEVRGKKAGSTTVTCKNTRNNETVTFKVTVKNPTTGEDTISRIGTKARTYTVGQEFELSVKKYNGAKERNLKWWISDTSVVKFADSDRYGDDMEFRAKKAGTVTITCKDTVSGDKVSFAVSIEKPAAGNTIEAVGSKNRTVTVGRKFELEVKKLSGAKDRNLKWSISDTSIVRFDDDERYGDDMEFRAKKVGTVSIVCKDTVSGDKVTYKVTVK